MRTRNLLPKTAVAAAFHVAPRSIDRWVRDAALGFPQPTMIRKRCYFDAAELEAWKAARLRKSIAAREALQDRGSTLDA